MEEGRLESCWLAAQGRRIQTSIMSFSLKQEKRLAFG